MKKKLPARMVDCCDVCNRQDSLLRKCLVCGGDYCWICNAVICGCVSSPDVCLPCGQRNDVNAICDRFAPRFAKVQNDRNEVLKKLPKKEKPHYAGKP